MGKNGLLERQRIERQAYFNAGLQTGRQQILDMMSVVLNDPAVMKKDVFGKRRLLVVVEEIGNRIDVFQKAWNIDPEADYYRDKLDEQLAKIYGKEMYDTFSKRYEYCRDYDYKKGKWL
jgi:hypothetical protein